MKKMLLFVIIMFLLYNCMGCVDSDKKGSKDSINSQDTIPGTDTDTDLDYFNTEGTSSEPDVNRKTNTYDSDESVYYSEKQLLMGDTDIYPTVMVEGHLYEWRFGRAIGGLPKESLYYGEIVHVDKKIPTDNCEFASAFSVSGHIYTVPGNTDSVYLQLTTDWMEKKNVAFDLTEEDKTKNDVAE